MINQVSKQSDFLQIIETIARRANVREQCIEGTESASNYVRGVFE